jgi:hypothetical protein
MFSYRPQNDGQLTTSTHANHSSMKAWALHNWGDQEHNTSHFGNPSALDSECQVQPAFFALVDAQRSSSHQKQKSQLVYKQGLFWSHANPPITSSPITVQPSLCISELQVITTELLAIDNRWTCFQEHKWVHILLALLDHKIINCGGGFKQLSCCTSPTKNQNFRPNISKTWNTNLIISSDCIPLATQKTFLTTSFSLHTHTHIIFSGEVME